MEITDALVTAIVKEIMRRLASGELSFTESSETKPEKVCPKPVCVTSVAGSSPGRKRVISEGDIRRLCPVSGGSGQVVEIGARDIVTPLAEDYISKMRIIVNRIG